MTNVGHKVPPETKIMSCLLIDQQPQKKRQQQLVHWNPKTKITEHSYWLSVFRLLLCGVSWHVGAVTDVTDIPQATKNKVFLLELHDYYLYSGNNHIFSSF